MSIVLVDNVNKTYRVTTKDSAILRTGDYVRITDVDDNQLDGRFGGGRGSNTPSLDWGGAVRIVWSVDGSPVAFPSTNVQHHETGLDASLKLNTQGASVKDTDYFDKTSSGFMLKTNTVLTTPNAKYIFLAIA